MLRIEDTDVERSKQHHAEQIVSSLGWLGIEWGEGPIYQSDRLDVYRDRANALVDQRLAYRCFCSVEELEAERGKGDDGVDVYRYSGRCRDGRPDRSADLPHVIRFRVEGGEIAFHDLIRGDVRFEAGLLDDFVLLRSDGNPTYHLSVVVDDIEMGITLVARGDDHLSNTPKHILLFRAFGSETPDFAHLPLILGSDKKRLSKRTGATSVEEYQTLGIVPDALFNFLALLGWSPGDDREVISREDAIAAFDLSDVHKSPAVFDLDKLLWMNGQYMAQMQVDEIIRQLDPFFDTTVVERGRLEIVVALNRTRARTLRELADVIVPYFSSDDEVEFEDEAVKKHLKGDEVGPRLRELRDRLAALVVFDVATTEAALREFSTESGVSAGKLIHPLRLALTGKGMSPPIFDVAVALGRQKALRRIDVFLTKLPALMGNN